MLLSLPQHRQHRRAALALALAALVALLGLALRSLPPPPLSHEQARALWQQHAPQHYMMDISSHSNGMNLHLRIEVRNRRMVGGINLRTGNQLNINELAPYQVWLPIERLFDLIEQQSHATLPWHYQISQLLPDIAHTLQWCYAQPMHVSYNQSIGNPEIVRFRQNSCATVQPLEIQLHVIPIANPL